MSILSEMILLSKLSKLICLYYENLDFYVVQSKKMYKISQKRQVSLKMTKNA